MSTLGIDCGVTGAVALVDVRGRLTAVADMPTVDGEVSPVLLCELLRDWWSEYGAVELAVVERLHAMPPPVGSKANFSKGLSYGIVLGTLAAGGVPVDKPTPAAWKRTMGVGKDKDAVRAVVLDAWPGSAETFKRKKDADRAEAALLAEYGRRLLADRAVAS